MIIIRAEFSSKSGFGHVSRSLVLYREFKARNLDVRFAAPSILIERLIGCGLSEKELIEIDKSSVKEELRGYPHNSVLILDIFSSERLTTNLGELEDYVQTAKALGHTTIALDGFGDDSFSAHSDEFIDVLIQPYYGAETLPLPNATRVLRGGQYALIGREYYQLKLNRSSKVPKERRHVLVSLGAADPQGYTEILVDALSQVNLSELCISVVIGPDFNMESINCIESLVANVNNISLNYSPGNLLDLLSKSDIFITGSGTSRYEAIAAGIPVIFGSIIESHVHSSLCFEENTNSKYIGLFSSLGVDEFKSIFEDVLSNGFEFLSERKGDIHTNGGASVMCDEILSFLRSSNENKK